MFQNGLHKGNILKEGRDLAYPDSVVDYFRGMMGQPDGGFPVELQKIVLKGQKPLSVRPGTLIPSADFDKIGKMLEEKFGVEPNMQRIISYALYPKVYEDYCIHKETFDDVTRLDSHVYFYGLRKGEETTLTIGEGKVLTIKFVDMSEPIEDGMRALSFEVNGSMRVVKILDKQLAVKSNRKRKADKTNPSHLGSTIPGTVGQLFVKEGDKVTVHMPVATVEAMKMETTAVSKVNGVVDEIYVKPGERVNQEDLLITFIVE